MIVSNSFFEYSFTTVDAVSGASLSIRISRLSLSYEKPLSFWSSCKDETPISAKTPFISLASTSRKISWITDENRPFLMLTLSPNAANLSVEKSIAVWSWSIPISLMFGFDSKIIDEWPPYPIVQSITIPLSISLKVSITSL